jgi:hypothetical protein
MASRLKAFIRPIAVVRSASSFSENTAAAAWKSASGTAVSATRLTVSAQGKSGAFACVKQVAGLAPRLDQHQLFDREALLNQVTRVHIDAIGATVNLRGSQINQIHQQPGQARLHNVAITERSAIPICSFRPSLAPNVQPRVVA